MYNIIMISLGVIILKSESVLSYDFLFLPEVILVGKVVQLELELNTVKSRIIVLMCYVVENSLPRKRGENRSEKGAAQPL